MSAPTSSWRPIGLRPPTSDQLRRYAIRHHLSTVEGFDDDVPRVEGFLRILADLDNPPRPATPGRDANRGRGRRPSPAEDPHHAITRLLDLTGAPDGALAGLRVGVKDTIAVAGVPVGDSVADLPDVIPDEDAVVVERLLDAGATIAATTATTSDVLNPIDGRFAPGGSSSGSAAAVAAGLVDAALGVDQGGSLRVPAAWCGLVGMKATHGLVPTYGLANWDHTLDHVGPITRTVAGNARVLEVIAGADPRDPQWVRADPRTGNYVGALGGGVRGLRIGLLAEALDPAVCTPGTLAVVNDASALLRDHGAKVETVSAPLWRICHAIWLATVVDAVAAMAESFGRGHGHLGRADIGRLSAMARRRLAGLPPAEPPDARAMLLTAEHLRQQRAGLPLARAHNLRLDLRDQLEQLFAAVDLLVMPTWPTGPDVIADQAAEAPAARGLPAITWTCAFNLSGHPALTVPFGADDDGMPGAVQIAGPRFGEPAVYSAGAIIESEGVRAVRSDRT